MIDKICPICKEKFGETTVREMLKTELPNQIINLLIYLFIIYGAYVYGTLCPSNETVVKKYSEITHTYKQN